jgi:hypothetical protein
MEVAQQMIDAGAVEDGEILFVDEMARIEFYAMLDDDLDDMPPDPPRATWRVWSNVEHKWFARQARGYTSNIEESGRFMPMEALQIYQRAAQGWNPQQPFPISITLVPV